MSVVSLRRRIEHLRDRRFLDAHVDGEFDAELASRVADHVADCPMCTSAANTTAVVKHRLRGDETGRPSGEREHRTCQPTITLGVQP